MRRDNSTFKTKFISEAGSFLRNADYFAFVEMEDYACYCIADGIDDDKKRNSAEIAVSTVITQFSEKKKMSKRYLKKYIEAAHKELLKETKDVRLEASILIMVTDYRKMRWIQAGNARLYHWRNGRIVNKSKDQSLSQEMAENGEISIDKIQEHEERHNLFCYLGQPGIFKPFISQKIKLEDGDIVTLCTRGIWENTGEPELLDSIEEANEPEDVCTGIEDIILSQRMKLISNYTMSCTYMNKVYQNPKRKALMKKILKIVIPVVLVCAVLGGMLGFKAVKKNNQIRTMWALVNEGILNVSSNNMVDAGDSFKRASNAYLSFTSNKDIKSPKISTANSYCTLFSYIEELSTVEDNEDKFKNMYISYCKLLNIADGVSYINENKLETIPVDVVDCEKLSTEYLSNTAKDTYDTLIDKYETEFESIKEKAEAYELYKATKLLLDAAGQDKSDYVDVAKVQGTYNFNKSDLGKNLDKLAVMVKDDAIKSEETFCNAVNALLADAGTLKYEIIAEAKEQLGNEEYQNGNLDAAKDYFEQAQDSYNKSGADHNDEVKDLQSAISDIKAKKQESANEAKLEKANKGLERANALYEAGNYQEAKEKYKSLRKVFDKLKVDSKVQEIDNSLANITLIEDAKKYDKKAKAAYSAEDYEDAQYWYEKEKANYDSLNLFDESRIIQKKLDSIQKKLDRIKEREEKAKAEKEKKKDKE